MFFFYLLWLSLSLLFFVTVIFNVVVFFVVIFVLVALSNKKTRTRETPTLSTDADSRADTILEGLRDLPIHTEKRTWSTQKCGLRPR